MQSKHMVIKKDSLRKETEETANHISKIQKRQIKGISLKSELQPGTKIKGQSQEEY
jgi:hypothetical protein